MSSDLPYQFLVQFQGGDPYPSPELTKILNDLVFDGSPSEVLSNLIRLGEFMLALRESASLGHDE